MAANREAIEALRAQLRRLEQGATPPGLGAISISLIVDARLPGRGLARGALHEVVAASSGAATAFCALLLARAAGAVVWLGPDPDVWPDGLASFGLGASDLLMAGARRSQDGLWAMEEVLRTPGLAGAVLVIEGSPPDMTAARRLQLAAEAGGGVGLLLLPDSDRRAPSAARSRWRVSSLPGAPSGRPVWRLELLRCSAGRPGQWDLEWNALTGVLYPSVPQSRAMAAR